MANIIGMQSIILLVFLLIPLFLFTVLQIFLASRKNKWLGLILPVLAFLLGTIIVVSVVALLPATPVGNSSYGYDADDISARINLYVDEDDHLQFFSDLRITDRKTGEKSDYELEFSESGELIGSKDALQYRKEIETITDGLGKDKLVGTSISRSEMKSLYRKAHKGETIAKMVGPMAGYIPFILSLVIYVVARKKVRKSSMAQGVEKMMIDDL